MPAGSPLSTQVPQTVYAENIDFEPARQRHDAALDRVRTDPWATLILFALLAACWLLRAFALSN